MIDPHLVWIAFFAPLAACVAITIFSLNSKTFSSLIAIAGFYGAGLMWGQKTSLPVVEYWRWWVIHLWVEGFFEVFATVIAAFLFVRMGLLNIKYATSGVIFATIVYLSGGIIGTFLR